MSVGKDVIARVHNVNEDDVKCSSCKFYVPLFCNAWCQETESDSYCSFYAKREEVTE